MSEIEVIFSDGMLGFVSSAELELLIESGEIIKFLRAGSWVFIGVDPTRSGEKIEGAGDSVRSDSTL